ncbi:MAG: hypothetical protein GEU94_06585 [Micromonosporaceae bacterium]|nr:hypothetical protein [Micromonosporaceae bacterium]
MWPFRRKPAPAPPSLPARAHEWRRVPAIQRMVAPIPLTVGTDAFERSLASRQNPSRLGELGHAVAEDSPTGQVSGLTDIAPPATPGDQGVVAHRIGVSRQPALDHREGRGGQEAAVGVQRAALTTAPAPEPVRVLAPLVGTAGTPGASPAPGPPDASAAPGLSPAASPSPTPGASAMPGPSDTPHPSPDPPTWLAEPSFQTSQKGQRHDGSANQVVGEPATPAPPRRAGLGAPLSARPSAAVQRSATGRASADRPPSRPPSGPAPGRGLGPPDIAPEISAASGAGAREAAASVQRLADASAASRASRRPEVFVAAPAAPPPLPARPLLGAAPAVAAMSAVPVPASAAADATLPSVHARRATSGTPAEPSRPSLTTPGPRPEVQRAPATGAGPHAGKTAGPGARRIGDAATGTQPADLSGAAPAPSRALGASLASQFGGGIVFSPAPEQSVVQREGVLVPPETAEPATEPAPALATPTPTDATADPAATATGRTGPELDDLARRLYERIKTRLKAELRLDRERAGLP